MGSSPESVLINLVSSSEPACSHVWAFSFSTVRTHQLYGIISVCSVMESLNFVKSIKFSIMRVCFVIILFQ